MKYKKLRALFYAVLLGAAGCSTPRSRIYFSQPENTRVFLSNPETTVVTPGMVDLPQTDDPGKVDVDEGGRPIRFTLPDGTKLQGFVYVYKSKLDQAEKRVLSSSIPHNRVL